MSWAQFYCGEVGTPVQNNERREALRIISEEDGIGVMRIEDSK